MHGEGVEKGGAVRLGDVQIVKPVFKSVFFSCGDFAGVLFRVSMQIV